MIPSLDRETATAAADRLKVYSQPQRLMILSALIDTELSVGAIDAATGVGQPALSQQLAELRRAELVSQRRDAKQVLYRLADDRTTMIVRFMSAVFVNQDEPLNALQAHEKSERQASTVHAIKEAAVFATVD